MEEKITPIYRATDAFIYLSFNVFSPAHTIERKQTKERLTLNHILELLPERLRNAAENLRSAHNMLTLLSLLRNFGNDTHRHIFTFKRIKFYVNLIYQKNNALETVIVLIKTIQSSVLYISNRIRQTIYFDIRAENCMRKCTKKIKHVPDSRKRLSAPLRPTKNEDSVRLKIRRVCLTKSTLVLHRRSQIIYINMTSHVLVN